MYFLALSCSCILTAAAMASPDEAIKPVMTLHGDDIAVYAVAFSPDDSILASGGYGGKIKLWRANGGKQIATLEGHESFVSQIAFTPNGNTLVSVSPDKTVRFWDVAKQRIEQTVHGHTDCIWSLAITPDGQFIATAGREKFVDVWDAKTFVSKSTIDDTFVTSLAISPDGHQLAAGGTDSEIRVWDLSTGTLQYQPKKPEIKWLINSLCFSSDGKILASTTYDNGKLANIWDAKTGELRSVLKKPDHKKHSVSVAFHPTQDSRRRAGAGPNVETPIYIFNLENREPILTSVLHGHRDEVRSLAFSHGGKKLASASCDQTVKVWELSK